MGLQVSTPPLQAPTVPQNPFQRSDPDSIRLPHQPWHVTTSIYSLVPQTRHQGHQTLEQAGGRRFSQPGCLPQPPRGAFRGGFGPLRAQETTSRMGPSDPLRKRYLRWRSGWNLAANDPVKLGSGRGNASTRALRRFLVFSLLITEKKAGPFPSHKSCGGVSPVCPTLGSRRFPALLPRRTNRGGKPPGSAGLPRVFSTRLKLSKRFHALLSPGIKILRFALNS